MIEPERPPSWLQTFGSVLASFFGVQSSRNRRRDFAHGKAVHFLIVGIVATASFVLVIWLIVRLVLSQAR